VRTVVNSEINLCFSLRPDSSALAPQLNATVSDTRGTEQICPADTPTLQVKNYRGSFSGILKKTF